jgi:hypothetical protein
LKSNRELSTKTYVLHTVNEVNYLRH